MLLLRCFHCLQRFSLIFRQLFERRRFDTVPADAAFCIYAATLRRFAMMLLSLFCLRRLRLY